jgi:hypothetical protein
MFQRTPHTFAGGAGYASSPGRRARRASVVLGVAALLVACGPTHHDFLWAGCLREDDCRLGCVKNGNAAACERALAYVQSSGHRAETVLALCEKVPKDTRCCAPSSELEGDNEVGRLAKCAGRCYIAKQSEFCEPFKGSGGETRLATACERTRSDEVCAGLPADTRAAIARANAAYDKARDVSAAELKEEMRQEEAARAARMQAEARARARCDADPACAARTRAQNQPRPPPSTPRGPSTPPIVHTRECLYTFVTGEPRSYGYGNLERHFYDAPDCGGVCCGEDVDCCIDRANGKERCGSPPPTSNTPAPPMCPNGFSPRDTRRDGRRALPILSR